MINEAPYRDPIAVSSMITTSWTAWIKKLSLYAGSINDSGTTANRPTKDLWIGRPYFDTTLGYIIHIKTVSPVVWVNGAGATV